ncbi:MAG TPA: hypothetical protein VGJ21_01075 [Terracidiphilus sp.]|jgi:hypothetical protein
MPLGMVLLLFALILVSLALLVRWEFRRMVKSREARMFDQLYNSRF